MIIFIYILLSLCTTERVDPKFLGVDILISPQKMPTRKLFLEQGVLKASEIGKSKVTLKKIDEKIFHIFVDKIQICRGSSGIGVCGDVFDIREFSIKNISGDVYSIKTTYTNIISEYLQKCLTYDVTGTLSFSMCSRTKEYQDWIFAIDVVPVKTLEEIEAEKKALELKTGLSSETLSALGNIAAESGMKHGGGMSSSGRSGSSYSMSSYSRSSSSSSRGSHGF